MKKNKSITQEARNKKTHLDVVVLAVMSCVEEASVVVAAAAVAVIVVAVVVVVAAAVDVVAVDVVAAVAAGRLARCYLILQAKCPLPHRPHPFLRLSP